MWDSLGDMDGLFFLKSKKNFSDGGNREFGERRTTSKWTAANCHKNHGLVVLKGEKEIFFKERRKKRSGRKEEFFIAFVRRKRTRVHQSFEGFEDNLKSRNWSVDYQVVGIHKRLLNPKFCFKPLRITLNDQYMGITLSFIPKDEHVVQIQFAPERVLAILVVIETQKLVYPNDMVEDLNLLKPNRIFRTEGYFVWSTFPAYHKDEKDQYVWNAVFDVTKSTSEKRWLCPLPIF
uniref:Methyltransferase n=1 Tax=Vitis vinifera TaxID=29760 RepID=A5AG62_VITVI|nr:hypothetical protein VITISV_042909 [Vitis vinifera]